MGSRAGLDRWGKSRPSPGFDPRTFQPLASRYTTELFRIHNLFGLLKTSISPSRIYKSKAITPNTGKIDSALQRWIKIGVETS